MTTTEHVGHVVTRLGVNRQGERRDPLLPALDQGSARVFDAVAPAVAVKVVGPAIGDQQQQVNLGRLPQQLLRRVANGGTDPGVGAGADPGDPALDRLAVALLEPLDDRYLTSLARAAAEAGDGVAIVEDGQR